MRTLTLSLGEYEFDDMSRTFSGNEIRRAFVMLLLITVIVFGTLTIYNLFIAVVITDVSDLKDSVFFQAGSLGSLHTLKEITRIVKCN